MFEDRKPLRVRVFGIGQNVGDMNDFGSSNARPDAVPRSIPAG